MRRKFTWIGSRISGDDMRRLYLMKQELHTPITRLVAMAVRDFIEKTQTKKEA